MSTSSKELNTVAHLAFLNDEAALKQLTTIFNRIAFGALWIALRPEASHFSTPEFVKNRSMLVDMGIVYEPDMEKVKHAADSEIRNSTLSLFGDVNEILKLFGTSVEEMIAARNDKEEFQKIRERTAVPAEELASKILDPERLMQSERRLTVNTTRLFGIQVRKAENSDAGVIIPRGDSSLDEDDQRPNKHDVLKFAVVIPVPDEQASWQQIIECRNDPDSQGGFYELKEWMSDIARGALAEAEAQRKLEFLLDQYRRVLQRHKMGINWTKLEAYIVTTANESHTFPHLQKGQSTSPLFAVEHRKLALLEGEPTLPGSVVAFVAQAKSMLSS